MINAALYKRGIQNSWKILVLIAMVITMYFVIIISMFDPALGSALNEFAKAMPELMAMAGMNPASAELVGFMEAYLYGFIMLVFPMLFCILLSHRLLIKHIDRGSMAYLLAAPVKRETVAFTQMCVMITGLLVLVIYATILGIVNCGISFPGQLDIGKFILLNFGALCLQLFVGGICFISACIFSDSKYAILAGAGIPTLAFVVQMAANTGEKLEKLKYLTFFSLYQSDAIVLGQDGAMAGLWVLLCGAVLLYASGIIIFSRKDLHI